MTVRELITTLEQLPPGFQVILQKDGEGNGYSPLSGAEEALYLPENKWSGEVWHPVDVQDLDAVEASKFQAVVVLWPAN